MSWLTKLLRADPPSDARPRYPMISAGWCSALVLLATVIAIGGFYAVLYEHGPPATTYLSMLVISLVVPWLGAIAGMRLRRPVLGVVGGLLVSVSLCLQLLYLHNLYCEAEGSDQNR